MVLPHRIGFVVVLFASLTLGCGGSSNSVGPPQAPQEAALRDVADLLRATIGDGKAPTKLTDLARLESLYPAGYQAVKSGEIVVIWGAKMAGEGDLATGPQGLIAHEKKAPTEGGWVLLQNGTVKQMTADEFKAAPKAK